MENNKMCPLVKEECIEDNCGWYIEARKECSIKTLARIAECTIDVIQDILEDKAVYYEK